MTFKLLYRRAAKESLKEGSITKEQYKQIIQVAQYPIRKRLNGNKIHLLKEVEKYVNENIPKTGLNWLSIIQWLKEHWLDILKIVATFIVLLEPLPNE